MKALAFAVLAVCATATSSFGAAIEKKDAGLLASLYLQASDASSDILSSGSSIQEDGAAGFQTRNCMVFLAFDFTAVQDWLHVTSRDALFAANLNQPTDRRNATVLLTSDLDKLDKITAATRTEINNQQGNCSSSALVSQKAQTLLGILSNISSNVGLIEAKVLK